MIAWNLCAPAPVAAQVGDDPIAELRADADALAAEGKLHDALVLLKAVDTDTLPPERAVALKGRIAELEAQKAKKLAHDLQAASALERAGDLEGAIARLDGVAAYGSAEDVEAARAEAIA